MNVDAYDVEMAEVDNSAPIEPDQNQEAAATGGDKAQPKAPTPPEPKPTPPEPKAKENIEPKKEKKERSLSNEDLSFIARKREEEARERVLDEIKSRYPDFEGDKVLQKIIEIEEKNPGAGKALYNPQGIELTYLRYFAKKDFNDFYDAPRVNNAIDIDEMAKRIGNGGYIEDEERFWIELGKK